MSRGPHGSKFDRQGYEKELTDLRHLLDSTEVVGWPQRDAELIELRRLVNKYTAEARKFINETDRAHDGDDPGATSPPASASASIPIPKAPAGCQSRSSPGPAQTTK